MADKKKVLFICTHNAARSQMAEGFLRHLFGDRCDAYSAGTHPSQVNPYAARAMLEIGIDISDHRSKSLDQFLAEPFDYVVTVCDRAKEECPVFPGALRTIHKSFQDPSKFSGDESQILSKFRAVRDGIREWIKETFAEL